MNDGYSALGGKFEYLKSDCDSARWSQYLVNTLQGLGEGPRGIAITCGHG